MLETQPRKFHRCWQQLVKYVALVGILSIGVNQSNLAQVVPDNTLGGESSVVAPDVTIRGIQGNRIDGGAVRGTNLFHSFSQFNISEGRGAYFTNPAGIDNILSRVTGGNRSEILGRLGVLGNANLFLINPNGIVFGASSSLDLQGSFLATTADAIRLGDTGLFSASQPATSNLLTVNPSALWFNAVAAQSIVNQSQASSLIGQPNSANLAPGLQVQPDRTLALIGGDVQLEGGRLTASGGRIELGSVKGVGNVSLIQSGNRFVLGYDSIQNSGTLRSSSPFGIVALSNQAFVDASGTGGGDIQVRGTRLEMTQNSRMRADTVGSEKGGDVLVRTSETVLSDNSELRARVTATGTGTGGNLTIETGRLIVRDGAVVATGTFGSGQGGSLLMTAADTVEVSGASSGIASQSARLGNAGNLTLNARRLIVRDGAVISASTFGGGQAGSLIITATDAVEISGVSSDGQTLSGVAAQSSRGNGNAGNLIINTGRLTVRNGASISTATFTEGKGGNLLIHAANTIEVSGVSPDGQSTSGVFTQSQGKGNAGDLTLNTRRLIVRDGSAISARTLVAGNSGNLLVNAIDAVELSGVSPDGETRSNLATLSRGSGNAGNLTINTGRLTVRDGAVVVASTTGSGKGGSLIINAADAIEVGGNPVSGLYNQALGSGNAGNIEVDTGSLLLRDGSSISGGSFGFGIAGNIDITVRDTLQANDSGIVTSSTRTQGGTITVKAGQIRLLGDSDIISNTGANNGGTITLTANSILAFSDSDILAFTRSGRGGDITLNTPAFFGENYRPAPSGTNPRALDRNNRVDVSATGTISSGIITLPDVSFLQNSLAELPDTQIDTNTLLANSCIVRREQPTQGSFRITGTGGFEQRPGETQTSSFPTVSIETLPSQSSSRIWRKGDPIVEPQGVYRLPNGKVVLSRRCS